MQTKIEQQAKIHFDYEHTITNELVPAEGREGKWRWLTMLQRRRREASSQTEASGW